MLFREEVQARSVGLHIVTSRQPGLGLLGVATSRRDSPRGGKAVALFSKANERDVQVESITRQRRNVSTHFLPTPFLGW